MRWENVYKMAPELSASFAYSQRFLISTSRCQVIRIHIEIRIQIPNSRYGRGPVLIFVGQLTSH